MLAVLALEPSVITVALSCFVIGIGLGFAVTPALIAAQASVPWNERGVVTGTNLFARSVGSAIGVAIFGAVANAIFADYGTGETDAVAVTAASAAVFLAVAIAAISTVGAALAMPRTPVQPPFPVQPLD